MIRMNNTTINNDLNELMNTSMNNYINNKQSITTNRIQTGEEEGRGTVYVSFKSQKQPRNPSI